MRAYFHDLLAYAVMQGTDLPIPGLSPNGPVRPALGALGPMLLVLTVGKELIPHQNRYINGDRGNFHHTPTQGGGLLAGALLVVLIVCADLWQSASLLAVFCVAGFGGLGILRDRRHIAEFPNPYFRKLPAWFHPACLFSLAVLFGLLVRLQDGPADHPLSWWGATCAIMLPTLMICGASCAVTISDGFEGLAAGIAAIVAISLSVLSVLTGDATTAAALHMTYVPAGNQWALVTAATGGACVGILGLGGRRTQIYMGRAGSLAVGGILGLAATAIHQECVALLVGGILVAELALVLLQITVFRITGGVRVFLCCPPHVHFRVNGWSESQVVHRYWIVSLLLAVCALVWATLR